MSNPVSRMPSGRLTRVLAPAVLLLILQNGPFASESARAAALTAAPEPASLLFVQTASRGRLSRGAHGGLTLTLKASRWTQSFTDRPRRAAQVQRTRTFVNEWGQRGFRSDPPNAALSIDRADGKVFTIELSHPRLSNGWLSYSIRRLKGSAKLRLGSFGTASLFIDNANAKWCFSMPWDRRRAPRRRHRSWSFKCRSGGTEASRSRWPAASRSSARINPAGDTVARRTTLRIR